jgi:hypothetical protein
MCRSLTPSSSYSYSGTKTRLVTLAALSDGTPATAEVSGVTLSEAAAVLALVDALADKADQAAARALAELLQGRELDQPARILIRWAGTSAG